MATVHELHQKGIPLAVASSSRRERLDRTLARAQLDTIFAVSVAGDEIARGKPAPDIFLLAAERLGAPPSSCLVLEDSAPGVRAALAAGMTAIMVPDQHAPPPDILAASTLVLPTLEHVHAHLKRAAANGIIRA